jgi:hypothetical protein
VRHGISPAALAVVRPVFVLWKKCNAAIDVAINEYRHRHYDALKREISAFYYDCNDATVFVVGIKLKGRLAHNTAMGDAIRSLTRLFITNPVCVGHIGGSDQDVEQSIKAMQAIDPNATRFWYDLDHTA